MLNDIVRMLKNYTYPAVLVTGLVVCTYLFIQDRHWMEKVKFFFRTRRWAVCFLFYWSFVITATVLGRQTVQPYRSIFSHLWFGDEKQNLEIVENILLYIPLTFLYLKAFPLRSPFQRALLVTVCTTAFCELSQLIFWLGEFQFSDLIYNTMGGLIGYVLWILIGKIARKK